MSRKGFASAREMIESILIAKKDEIVAEARRLIFTQINDSSTWTRIKFAIAVVFKKLNTKKK